MKRRLLALVAVTLAGTAAVCSIAALVIGEPMLCVCAAGFAIGGFAAHVAVVTQ